MVLPKDSSQTQDLVSFVSFHSKILFKAPHPIFFTNIYQKKVAKRHSATYNLVCNHVK